MKQHLLKSFCLALFICLMGAPHNSKATHIMGSDITWQCLGNDSFLVTLSLYRDCNGCGIPNCPHMNINVTSSCGSFTAITTKHAPEDITPNCDEACSRCLHDINDPGSKPGSGPTCPYQYGVQRILFTAIIYLGNLNCCDITFSSVCGGCRNSIITTGPANQTFYVEAKLNKCVIPCSNSPVFTQIPVTILCIGQCVILNHGAIDPDGDSLVYSLTPPLQNATLPVTYDVPYTYKLPLFFNGFPNDSFPYNFPQCRGFHLNPETGDLLFKPMQKEVTVIAIKVEKFRNGVKIGETRRDMQLIIDPCPNNDAPYISGINNTTSFNTEVCAGSEICFSVYGLDDDVDDSLTMTWNAAISGATFTITPGKRPVGVFCWTPTESQASTIPYYFTVKVQDDACPINAISIRAFRILVKPLPSASRAIMEKECGEYNFKSTTSPVSSTITWSLSGPGGNFLRTQNDFDYKFQAGGEHPHIFNVMSGGCVRTYFDTLVVPYFTTVDIGRDSTVCEGSTFNINSTVEWGQAVSYLWSTGDTTSYLNNVTLVNDSVFSLSITDLIGCINTDIVKFSVNKFPRVDLGSDIRICSDDSVVISPAITYLDTGDPVKNYTWYNLLNNTIIGTQPSITLSDSGTYSIQVADSLGCSDRDTINLFVNPEIDIYPPAPTICYGDTVSISAFWSNTSTYKWTIDGNPAIISTDPILTVWPTTTTTYRITVQETSGNVKCENTKTVIVTVNDTPIVNIGKLEDRCIDAGLMTLNMGSPAGGIWTGKGVSFIIPAYRFNPSLALAGTHLLLYTYTDPNTGCIGRASDPITVHPLPDVDAREDFSMCTNDAPLGLNSRDPIPGGGFWNAIGNAPNGFVSSTMPQHLNPGVAQQGFYRITYTYTSSHGCSNKDTVRVTINQSPVVTSGSYGPVCEGDAPLILNGLPSGNGGSWIVNTNDTLAGNTFNPVTAGTFDLTYCYTTTAGCTECTSTSLVVNPKPVLSISSSKSDVCENDMPVDLNASPAGGFWTGKGVQGNRFHPENGNYGANSLAYNYTDNNGCNNSSMLFINVQQQPEIKITGGSIVCVPFSNELEAEYKWAGDVLWSTKGDGVFSTITGTRTIYTPHGDDIVNGEYWIIARTTNNGSCGPAFDSILVKMHPAPQPEFVVDIPAGCQTHHAWFTDKSTISSGNISQFHWDFGDGYTSDSRNPSHSYQNHGKYTVRLDVVSDQGCENSITKNNYIEVYSVPMAAFTPKPGHTTVVLPTITFENQTTNAANPAWSWYFDDHTRPGGGTSTSKNPIYMYEDAGTYEVMLAVTTKDGCVDTAYRVVVIDPHITVFVPNAFSPLSQGPEQNNIFKPVVNGVITYNLQVYSRWGELLFETINMEEGWDGKYRGEFVSEGVFVYIIKAKSFDNKNYTYTGTITLLR